jgi:iturin family lipopeptide synthetase A
MSVADYGMGEPKSMTIVKLFEAQVAKSPDATAVRFEQKDLTYTQLNHRSNQLAHFRQILGTAKEQMIGLFLERSLEMFTGILGVLKAGGAYVPFDPDCPIERTSYMLKDTQLPILLTQSHLRNKISALLETGLVFPKLKMPYLDADWDDIAQERTDNPLDGAAEENLAYTSYTSRTTVSPKGIMNEHQGIYNRMMWMLDALPYPKMIGYYKKTPIDKLASSFIHSAKELIRHCQSTTAANYTPSDFPEANLSQQELDDLLSEIEEFGG